jgi:non-ribosomal peptide synthetase component F
MGYDPEQAIRSVRELAAITDDELAADVQVALAHTLEAWATWRADPAFPRDQLNRDREALVDKVAVAIRALPDDADLEALVKIARQLLNSAWGLRPGEQPVADAVERLRHAAIHRPGLVKESRAIAKYRDG